MRNEVDIWETTIIKEAEYFTVCIYTLGIRMRYECASFIDAVEIANKMCARRNLIYAVRHPNQALVATCVQGKWELAKFRGIDHPFKDFQFGD